MVLTVLKPGPLATLQGSARRGLRHQGIPASGPGDPLCMAVANRLAGNLPDATAIEITMGGAEFEFRQDTAFSFAGACSTAMLNDLPVSAHETCKARRGDRLVFAHPPAGVRTYLAIPGGFRAKSAFSSTSTFLPAAFGGYDGRALCRGDQLLAADPAEAAGEFATPAALRPAMSRSHALRTVPGPDYEIVKSTVWEQSFQATNRMDRTGIEIAGPWPKLAEAGRRPSAAIFEGAVQLTPSGTAFILLPDAQTTGGYPHVLQVIRADRHLLGQIAPGDRVVFLRRSVDEAHQELKAKTAYFADWLPDFRF